jgi:hypothetical protein
VLIHGVNHWPATSVISAKVACWVRVVGRKELTAVVSCIFKAGSDSSRTENAEGRTERMTALRDKMA